MSYNAYILDWTMERPAQLRQELATAGFAIQQEERGEHLRVAVPFGRVNEFASLCQAHLNAPFNYVDIQYPNEKKSVVVFKHETFVVSSREENEKVKAWAIRLGLPAPQAEWATSF